MAKGKGSDSTELSAIRFYLGIDTQDEDFDKATQKLNEFKNSFQDLQKDTKLTLDTGKFGTIVQALLNGLQGLVKLYDRAEALSAKMTAKDSDNALGVYTPRQVQAMYRTDVDTFWQQFGGSSDAQKDSIRKLIAARADVLQHGSLNETSLIALNQIAMMTGDQSLAGNQLANMLMAEDYETAIRKLLEVTQRAAYDGNTAVLAEIAKANILSEGDMSAMIAAGTLQAQAGVKYQSLVDQYRGGGANISPAEAKARSQQEYEAMMANFGNTEAKSQWERMKSDTATVVTSSFAPYRQRYTQFLTEKGASAATIAASLNILDSLPAQAAQMALERGIVSNQGLLPETHKDEYRDDLLRLGAISPTLGDAARKVFEQSGALGHLLLTQFEKIFDGTPIEKLPRNILEGLQEAFEQLAVSPLLTNYGKGTYRSLINSGMSEEEQNTILLQKTGINKMGWQYLPSDQLQEEFYKRTGWHDANGWYALEGKNDEFHKQERLEAMMKSDNVRDRFGAILGLAEVSTSMAEQQGKVDFASIWSLISGAFEGAGPEASGAMYALLGDAMTKGGEVDYNPLDDAAAYEFYKQLMNLDSYHGFQINHEGLDRALAARANQLQTDEGIKATGVLDTSMAVRISQHNVTVQVLGTEGTVTLSAPNPN